LIALEELVVASGGAHCNGLADVAYIHAVLSRKHHPPISNVTGLSPVKVRTTLLGGQRKMLVWMISPFEKVTCRQGVQVSPAHDELDATLQGSDRVEDSSRWGRAAVYEPSGSYGAETCGPRSIRTEALQLEPAIFWIVWLGSSRSKRRAERACAW